MLILLEFNHIPGKDRNVIPRLGQLNIVGKTTCKSPRQFPWLRVSSAVVQDSWYQELSLGCTALQDYSEELWHWDQKSHGSESPVSSAKLNQV